MPVATSCRPPWVRQMSSASAERRMVRWTEVSKHHSLPSTTLLSENTGQVAGLVHCVPVAVVHQSAPGHCASPQGTVDEMVYVDDRSHADSAGLKVARSKSSG